VSQDWKIWWWLDIILQFPPAAADAAAARNEVLASLNARPLIDDLCLPPHHRQDPPPDLQPPQPSIQPYTPAGWRHTIKAILPPLRLDLREIVVCPRFPFPTGFRFWLHSKFTEQCLATPRLGARASVFDVRVVIRRRR
jgi:hypothetical protein